MSLQDFQSFPPLLQLAKALKHGTFLAQRWNGESGVNLYYLTDEARGFFVEVGYDAATQDAVVLRSFSNNAPLEEYVYYVRLPDEL
ncbi:hypothetical protein FNT36_14295 [Hymenobacter setariae]|uniref:Uncharacterized protein n=1 Tax=Hymenobacter setariae TaxID=2594794 RepID=A0A558BVT9_9BACT|nr:hypothetical protein [Hymenobacter setariae]TVT40635.1 hypothetical protein FNT36_14295 [Hymenobacter setariae]